MIISDSGDNPTAGGAGDIPYFTERLLAHPDLASGARSAIVAAVLGPEAVITAQSSGIGATVTVSIGGVLDPVNGTPLTLTGTVFSLLDGDPIGGDVAVIKSGGVHVIVPTRRRPCHRVADLLAPGLDPATHDITVVKIGYLEPDLRRAAAASFIALKPGAVNQDIASLPFKHVPHPFFPLDPDMLDPDLTATIFPPIGT